MSSSNQRRNRAEIDKYRKDLKRMLDDISDIDTKVLNRSVNEGLGVAKQNTHVVTGFMKKSWSTSPTIKKGKAVTKSLFNTADYSSYVNYGHRTVNSKGETTGWVEGQYMLEKAISKTEKTMAKEFSKEVRRINGEHNK